MRQSTRKPRTPSALDSASTMMTAAETIGSHGGHDIQLNVLQIQPDLENSTTILDQISYGFVSVGGFIYQNSYIFTNILMMVGLIDSFFGNVP